MTNVGFAGVCTNPFGSSVSRSFLFSAASAAFAEPGMIEATRGCASGNCTAPARNCKSSCSFARCRAGIEAGSEKWRMAVECNRLQIGQLWFSTTPDRAARVWMGGCTWRAAALMSTLKRVHTVCSSATLIAVGVVSSSPSARQPPGMHRYESPAAALHIAAAWGILK